MTKELNKKVAERNILKWIVENEIKNEKGEPISFDRHPFLIQIYNDMSKEQIALKSSQVGFSTAAILKSFFLAKTKSMSVIHTLPTADFADDFVKSKVDPIIYANPNAFEINKKKDSLRQKEIGVAHLFYRGTFTANEAISISADLLISDEYDRSDLKIVSAFESRLDFSKYRYIWKFSNPSIPGYGIDLQWQNTKQYHWFIKCPHCGFWQYMVFPDSIDFVNQRFCCIKCKKEIDDETRINGNWIARYRNRDVNGYWISQLFCVWHSAKDIIKKYYDQNRDVFYNFTIGIPYQGSDVSIRKEHVLRCLTGRLWTDKTKVIGIDQGGTFYAAIGGLDGLDRLKTLGSWDEVDNLIGVENPNIVIIDGMPEVSKVKELQEKYGFVFPCYYKEVPDNVSFASWVMRKKDREVSVVYVDRFKSLNDLLISIYNGDFPIYMDANDPMLDLFVRHLESMYRCESTNKVGQNFYTWKSSNQVDHFVHAVNYMLVGVKRIKTMVSINQEEDDEEKRPYEEFETPEERLERYDKEYLKDDIPDYLLYTLDI